MRADSPLVLALAGTLAIHTLLLVGADAVIVISPKPAREVAPRIELVDVEIPARPLPPPPPPPPAPPPPEPETPPPPTPPPPAPRPQAVRQAPARETAPPPPADTPPPPPAATDDPGGAPVVAMPDIAPAATGVPAAVGARTTGRIGRGGRGGGTGEGTGSGAAPDPVPAPVSVATIKTRALPKGDYGYVDAGRDYPPEARQLGIEGVIRVRLVVDPQGKVKSAVLLNKLGHGLDELALSRARQIEFEPARDTEDKPVTSVVVWTFNMTLPK